MTFGVSRRALLQGSDGMSEFIWSRSALDDLYAQGNEHMISIKGGGHLHQLINYNISRMALFRGRQEHSPIIFTYILCVLIIIKVSPPNGAQFDSLKNNFKFCMFSVG